MTSKEIDVLSKEVDRLSEEIDRSSEENERLSKKITDYLKILKYFLKRVLDTVDLPGSNVDRIPPDIVKRFLRPNHSGYDWSCLDSNPVAHSRFTLGTKYNVQKVPK